MFPLKFILFSLSVVFPRSLPSIYGIESFALRHRGEHFREEILFVWGGNHGAWQCAGVSCWQEHRRRVKNVLVRSAYEQKCHQLLLIDLPNLN